MWGVMVGCGGVMVGYGGNGGGMWGVMVGCGGIWADRDGFCGLGSEVSPKRLQRFPGLPWAVRSRPGAPLARVKTAGQGANRGHVAPTRGRWCVRRGAGASNGGRGARRENGKERRKCAEGLAQERQSASQSGGERESLERDIPMAGNAFQRMGLGGGKPAKSVVRVIDFNVSGLFAQNAENEPRIDAGCAVFVRKWLRNPSQGCI